MKLYNPKPKGFTLLELMVVITIIAILASVSTPAFQKAIAQARCSRDALQIRSVALGMRSFASDFDGSFPFIDDEGEEFTTSTDAFQYFMQVTSQPEDAIYYVKGNPDKTVPPNNDGVLEPEECCYSYVSGQVDSTWSISPLIAHEMTGAGTFGTNHPYLKDKKAVVAYVGGAAKVERLTSATEGATIRGPQGSGIDNIFGEGELDEDGKLVGEGYLSVSSDQILHPQ